MRNTYHNKLKYNLYMDYWYQNKTVEQLYEQYSKDENFNFRDKLQLHRLLNNEWRDQEIKTMIIDYQRAQERARINLNAHIRKEKQIAKLEARRIRGKMSKEKQLFQLITECSKKLLAEYTDYICKYFSNPYRLFKRPVFFFIHNHIKKYQNEFGISVKWMCEFLNVTERGYYKWISDGMKIQRDIDFKLLEIIFNTWMKFNFKNSGRRKLKMEIFLHHGINIGERKIYEYSNLLGIQSECKDWGNEIKPPKEYKVKNPLVDNMLKIEGLESANDWETTKALEKLSIDETYILTKHNKWLYLNACIDQHTGFIVSYELGDHRDTKLAIKTLKKASERFNLKDSIIHSDRAKTYNSMEYINYCKEKNIVQSMNDRPISTQNLPIEKFFDIFKNEFLKKIDVALGTKIHLKKKSIYL